MKRILSLSLFILLLLAGQGWAATFYVSTTGSNTSPYDTPAKAALVPSTVITYIKGLGSPDATNTINIAAGAYSAAGNMIRLDSAKLAGLTIQGAGSGLTSITSTTTNTVVITAGCGNNVALNGMAFYGGINRVVSIGVAVNVSMNDIDVVQTGSAASLQAVYLNSATLTINKFRTFGTTGQSVYVDGNTTATISNFLGLSNNVLGGVAAANCAWQFANTGGTITLNDGNILDASNAILESGAGGTVVGNNLILQGGTFSASAYAVQRTAGTLTLNNSVILGPDDQHITSGTMTLNNCYQGYAPGFTKPIRGGYIVPTVDQISNNVSTAGYGYVSSISQILAAKGMKGTWYIDPIRVNLTGSATTTQLQNFLLGNSGEGITAGIIELGTLGRCHSILTYAHALDFSHVGGTLPTVTYDGTTITCTAVGGDYTVTFATTPGTSTITDVITAMNGQKGWTVAKSATGGQTATSIDDFVLTTSFATQTVTAAPCTIDFNRDATLAAGYLKDEIAGGKALIESIVGSTVDPQTGLAYSCHSNGAPYNSMDATAITGFYNGSYWGARGTGRQQLCSVQAFSLPYYIAIPATEANTRIIARSLGFQAAQSGQIWVIESHTTADWTTDQWTWAVDEWSKIPGLTVTSMQLAMKDIRTSGLWTDGTGGVWTRSYTMTDTSGCKLTPISVGLKTGIAASGVTTDFAGNPVPAVNGAYNIGAYNNQYLGGGVGLGLTGWNFPGYRH